MRRRVTLWAGAAAVMGLGAGFVLATPAHASTAEATSVTIPSSCTVVPLGNGLQITLCV